jgi:hypothetical protein
MPTVLPLLAHLYTLPHTPQTQPHNPLPALPNRLRQNPLHIHRTPPLTSLTALLITLRHILNRRLQALPHLTHTHARSRKIVGAVLDVAHLQRVGGELLLRGRAGLEAGDLAMDGRHGLVGSLFEARQGGGALGFDVIWA